MADFDAIICKINAGPPICDFCGDPAMWRYPCKDLMGDKMPRYVGGTVTLASKGDWAACDGCSKMIEDGKWLELSQKSVTHAIPEKLNAQQYEMVLDMATNAHGKFKEGRTGPRYSIKERS